MKRTSFKNLKSAVKHLESMQTYSANIVDFNEKKDVKDPRPFQYLIMDTDLHSTDEGYMVFDFSIAMSQGRLATSLLNDPTGYIKVKQSATGDMSNHYRVEFPSNLAIDIIEGSFGKVVSFELANLTFYILLTSDGLNPLYTMKFTLPVTTMEKPTKVKPKILNARESKEIEYLLSYNLLGLILNIQTLQQKTMTLCNVQLDPTDNLYNTHYDEDNMPTYNNPKLHLITSYLELFSHEKHISIISTAANEYLLYIGNVSIEIDEVA